MLRAFQSGPVAQQFGKLVGRRKGRGAASPDALEEDDMMLELDHDMMELGVQGGDNNEGPEGFSPADRLLAAVSQCWPIKWDEYFSPSTRTASSLVYCFPVTFRPHEFKERETIFCPRKYYPSGLELATVGSDWLLVHQIYHRGAVMA